MADARHQRFGFASEGLAAPAGIAVAAIASMPADTDALSRRPATHPLSNRVYRADDFVSRHARIDDAGEQALLGDAIAVTDPAGGDLDPHLAGAGFGDVALDQLERAGGIGDLGDAHFGRGAASGSRAAINDTWASQRRKSMP